MWCGGGEFWWWLQHPIESRRLQRWHTSSRGVQYGKLRDMQEARRARYVQLLEEGLNFTQAAHAVGVSKRTGRCGATGEPVRTDATKGLWSIGMVDG